MRRLFLFCLSCIPVTFLLAQQKPLPYDAVEPFVGNMAIVSKNGKYGFVNRAYQECVPLKYDLVFDFSDGVAAVSTIDSLGFDDWIFVDTAGRQAVPGNYSSVRHSFKDGLAVVRSNDKDVIINKKGEIVAEVQDHWDLPLQYGFVVTKDSSSNYGVSNLKGKTLIPMKYYSLEIVSPLLVIVKNKEEKSGFLNTKGKQLTDMRYEYVEQLENGLFKVGVDGKFGLLNREGKALVAPQYDQIEDFGEGLAAVEKKEKWGFVDERGKEVIPVRFDDVDPFSFGKSKVSLNDKKSYINKKGNAVGETYNDAGIPFEGVSQQVAEKTFLDQLNKLIKDYPYTGYKTEDSAMLSDSLLVIRDGVITGTFKHHSADGIIYTKMTAPVAKITYIWLDYNMGLGFEDMDGIVETTKPGSSNYTGGYKTDMLQLATPGDGKAATKWKGQVEIALKVLQQFYPQ